MGIIVGVVLAASVAFQALVTLTVFALCLYVVLQHDKTKSASLESAMRYLASRTVGEKVSADVAEKIADKELKDLDAIVDVQSSKPAPLIVHTQEGREVDLSNGKWEVL